MLKRYVVRAIVPAAIGGAVVGLTGSAATDALDSRRPLLRQDIDQGCGGYGNSGLSGIRGSQCVGANWTAVPIEFDIRNLVGHVCGVERGDGRRGRTVRRLLVARSWQPVLGRDTDWGRCSCRSACFFGIHHDGCIGKSGRLIALPCAGWYSRLQLE